MSFIISPYRYAAVATGFFGDIQGVSLDASLINCLDAGALDSYDGSAQDWLDQTGTGNDWWRGATSGAESTDPTFNGTPGDESNAEYFSFDGGDYFTNKSINAAFDPFHQNNATYTLLCWLFVPTGGMDNSRVFSNCGTNASSTGVQFGTQGPGTADDAFSSTLKSSASAAMSQTTSQTLHVTANAWNLVGVSLDEAAGAAGSGWYKRSGASSTFTTFNGTYTTPSAGAATHAVRIGAIGDTAASPFKNGTRVAGMFIFDAALTQANIDSIYTATNRSFV